MNQLKRAVHLFGRSASCRCRNYSQAATAVQEKWMLLSAVLLERAPVITAPFNPLEEEYAKLLEAVEIECSDLSNHEIKHLKDLELAEKLKKQDDLSSEEALLNTALDFQDIWDNERKQFTPASRATEADKSGNLNTHNRQLDRRLVLLVKQSFPDQNYWALPQSKHQPGETMRESAERTLGEVCGDGIKASFLGNAPIGVTKLRFREPAEDGSTGGKVFFFRALLREGDVNKKVAHEHMWLNRNEIKDYLTPRYHKAVWKVTTEF